MEYIQLKETSSGDVLLDSEGFLNRMFRQKNSQVVETLLSKTDIVKLFLNMNCHVQAAIFVKTILSFYFNIIYHS